MITKLSETGHFVNLDRLDKDSIIVDAGACLGLFIDDMRNHDQTKHSLIIAIEPNKNNIETLQLRKKDVHLRIYQKALAGDEDKLTFYDSWFPGWGSTQRPPPQPITSYPVKTIKINEIFKKFAISHIDYMKIVIEGDEKRMLEAMTLKTAKKIKQIALEFHNQYGATREYVVDKLEKLGFEVKAAHYKEVYGDREIFYGRIK